jgi:hypothetical protein
MRKPMERNLQCCCNCDYSNKIGTYTLRSKTFLDLEKIDIDIYNEKILDKEDFEIMDSDIKFQCRIKSPTIKRGKAFFPIMKEFDWCGEYYQAENKK